MQSGRLRRLPGSSAVEGRRMPREAAAGRGVAIACSQAAAGMVAHAAAPSLPLCLPTLCRLVQLALWLPAGAPSLLPELCAAPTGNGSSSNACSSSRSSPGSSAATCVVLLLDFLALPHAAAKQELQQLFRCEGLHSRTAWARAVGRAANCSWCPSCSRCISVSSPHITCPATIIPSRSPCLTHCSNKRCLKLGFGLVHDLRAIAAALGGEGGSCIAGACRRGVGARAGWPGWPAFTCTCPCMRVPCGGAPLPGGQPARALQHCLPCSPPRCSGGARLRDWVGAPLPAPPARPGSEQGRWRGASMPGLDPCDGAIGWRRLGTTAASVPLCIHGLRAHAARTQSTSQLIQGRAAPLHSNTGSGPGAEWLSGGAAWPPAGQDAAMLGLGRGAQALSSEDGTAAWPCMPRAAARVMPMPCLLCEGLN